MFGATPFLKEKEIKILVKKLAKRIDETYQSNQEKLVVVCMLKGSLFFMADLIRELKTPTQIEFISIESLEGGFHILKDIKTPIENRDVLIVKDVVNEGNKLLFLKKRLEANSPRSVRIAALLDKPSRRELDLVVDFFGRTIEDRYVFGYGMDSNELHRNLKDIFNFTQ